MFVWSMGPERGAPTPTLSKAPTLRDRPNSPASGVSPNSSPASRHDTQKRSPPRPAKYQNHGLYPKTTATWALILGTFGFAGKSAFGCKRAWKHVLRALIEGLYASPGKVQ